MNTADTDGMLNPPPNDPPMRLPLWKRTLEHSVKIAMCFYSVETGTMLMIRALTGAELPASLQELPLYLTVLLCAFAVAGGVFSIMGMFGTDRNLRKQLNHEQLGWLLMTFAWAGYIISALVYAPTINIVMSVSPWLALGSLGRFIWLTKVERALDEDQHGTGEEDAHQP